MRRIDARSIIRKIFALLLTLFFTSQAAYSQTNISGKAISFNGTTGYLSVPSGAWFNGSFTIEGWVYVRSHKNWARLIDFSNGPDHYNVYLALSGNNFGYPNFGVFGNGSGPSVDSSTPLPLNQWTHLAAVLASGGATIYINGKVVGSGLLMNAPGVTRTNNYIGRSAYPSDEYPDAIFDDIRIWNVSRTQSQIQANMNHPLAGNEDFLVGYWRADEGSGASAFSTVTNNPAFLIPNGGTATLAGSATWINSAALITPSTNYALGFTNTLVTIPHTVAQNAYPLTVMCWFSTSSQNGAMVNKYSSASLNGWQLAFGSQVHAWYYRDGANFVGNTGGGAIDNLWHHAAWVVDSGGGHLYIDGTLKSTTAWAGTPGASTTTIPISLGIYQGDSFFTGGVDEVSVWNTALTVAQIQYYKNYAPHGTEPGLVGLYRLNEGIGTNVFDGTTNLNSGFLNSPPPIWIPSLAQIYLPPSIIFTQAVSFTGNGTVLTPLVNPNGSATAVWVAYYSGQTGTLTTNLLSANIGNGSNNVPVPAVFTNLPTSTFYDVSIIASNGADRVVSKDIGFVTPSGFAPSIGLVSGTTGYTNANFSINVNPNSATATVRFAYGTTTNYGTTNVFANIASSQTVLDVITNLQPGTAYHLLITASNAYGSTSSSDVVFGTVAATAPSLTNIASEVTFTNTTLSALVQPNGSATTVWLVFGSVSGVSTTNVLANIAGGDTNGFVSQIFTNLAIQTAYHFSIIASNAFGTVSSGDIVFQSASYLLGMATLIEPPQAGADGIVLGGIPSGLSWSASATVPWVHLNSFTNGIGGQTIIFNFDQNPGAPRTGAIHFGNQTVDIVQASAGYLPANAGLDLAVGPTLGGYMALDRGNNLYFNTASGNQISRVDYFTKAIIPVYSSPSGCYQMGLDTATNVYFFDQFAALFKLPFGAGAASPLLPSTGGIFNMAVASSGDVYFQNPNQGISVLPHSTNTARVLIPGNISLIPTWNLDPCNNLYLYYYTNAQNSGTVFKWSSDTLSLTPVFSSFFTASIRADGSGNIDLLNSGGISGRWSPVTGSFYYYFPQQTNQIYSTLVDNRGDTFTFEVSSGGAYFIREYPRAFVNSQNIAEGSAAGTDSVAMVVPTDTYLGGSLAPTSSAPWLTINGVTNGTITFSFSAFAGPGNRTAYLKILGINVPVTQGSPTYSLGAGFTVEPPAAGTDSVVLAVSPALASWTATANNSWLHLAPEMQSGSGSGPIVFSFDANSGATRTGSLTLGGQTFTVTQAGSTYVPTASPLPVGTSSNTIYSLAVDSGGNGVGSIYQFNGSGFYQGFWQWLRASNAVSYTTLGNVPAVAGDWLGNIYTFVFSTPPYVIQRYNPTNHTFTPVMSSPVYQPGTETSQFAVDKQGNIFFPDLNTYELVEYVQATAQFQKLATGPFSARSMTTDPAGNVFWSDNDNTIKKWNATSLLVSVVLSNVIAFSVAADAGGNLFYLDGSGGQLRKLSAVDGSVTAVPFVDSAPSAIAVDPAGNLYLAFNTGSGCDIREIPRAFVDTTPKIEGLGSGQDILPPVVLTNANLLPPFSPASDQPWLTIAGVTNGAVQFAFTSTASARAGNLTVLGQRIAVTQGTNYFLAITNLLEGPAAGLDSFVFGTIPAQAAWTASTNAPWLHFVGSGAGGGNQIFSYDANPGATRSGAITIAGQILTVTQAGSNYVAANPLTVLLYNTNGLGAPCGVAVGPANNVYFCDTYNNAIKAWNPTNQQVRTLASTGFNVPYALAVDASGNVYIADTGNSVIKKWTAANSNLTTIVSSGLANPYGVAVDAAGNVYISDTGHSAIKKWNPVSSSIATIYSSPGSAPKGVAVDAIGNIYWIEQGTGQVREWLAQSNSVITLFTPPISDPYGVAVDGRGNVYLADYNYATTYEWIAASNTVITRVANTIGVAVDAAGNQFIANALDSQIYEVPRAFVDPRPKTESLNAGQDALPPVLPTNQNLLPPFAPQSTPPWLAITGVTNGAVSFAFSASASPRSGIITLLGQSIFVTQGTNFVLGTTNLTEAPGAGSDSFVLGVIPAAWTASANVPWLHVPASGVGSGNVIFSFDANSGPTRSGTITIGTQSLNVTQAGATYVLANPPTYLAGGNAPCGVAVDAAGNVYFCDTYSSAVRVWCPTNNQVTTLGDTGFNIPYALTVDRSGNVFIADTYNNVLKKWSSANSNITTVVTNLITPFGVAADGAGNIYIGDTGHDSVKEWFPGTNGIITLYSNANTSPRGVAVDAIGNVYWAEGTGQVRKWSVITNNVTTVFSFGPAEPRGVAVDGSGNVYLADYGTATTYRWSAASNTVSTMINGTIGVAVDVNGNQYIASADGFLIYEVPRAFVDPTTRIVTPAGGQDVLPPILPTNENLLPPLQPTTPDAWINFTGNSGGAVHFTFPPNASPRASSISLYGNVITILQTNNVFPPFLTGMQRIGPATMQFSFTNNPNASFTVLAATNLAVPFSNWTALGTATNLSNGVYQFTDPHATNPAIFYRVRSP